MGHATETVVVDVRKFKNILSKINTISENKLKRIEILENRSYSVRVILELKSICTLSSLFPILKNRRYTREIRY